jgi:flagellar biosynthetic protein FliS
MGVFPPLLRKKCREKNTRMQNAIPELIRRGYFEERIRSAHPVEIVALLFRVAIESLQEAIQRLESGDRFARSSSITRAEYAIQELLFSLDHSVYPSFSRTASGLYRYALDRIVAGHAQESEKALQDALAVLEPLSKAWEAVRARICDDPGAGPQQAEAPAEPPRESAKGPHSAYLGTQIPFGSRDWSC